MKVNTTSQMLPLAARFGQELGITSQLYLGLIARLLQPHDLTYAQFALLVHLSRQPRPTRISDMARTVEMTQSAVTKAVQKFAALGWVDIRTDSADQRNRPVQISAAGQGHVLRVQRSFGPAFAVLMQGWQEEELEQMIDNLARLRRQLDALRNPGAAPE